MSPGRVAYVDLASGAAGDMLLAACVDVGRRLGIDVEGSVHRAVAGLSLGCTVSFSSTTRAGLACVVATVDGGDRNVGIDGLRDAIGRADVAPDAKASAAAALEALVLAESRSHGSEPADVHLHELGEADTAVDLLGVAVALDALGVGELRSAPVPVPRGWTTTAHGPVPLPAPTTLELLAGIPVEGVDATSELVTPTAAALLRVHATAFGAPPAMRLDGVGVGGGSRDLPRPNVCRLLVGTPTARLEDVALDIDVLLETNVDDATSETVGRTLEALFAAGAKDAWVTPIVMKRSRPAFMVSVLADPSLESRVLEVLFRETTTLGARRRIVEKWTLPREVLDVAVRGSTVRVKVGRLDGDAITVSPEYLDCAAVADRVGVAFRQIYEEASSEARRTLRS